MRLIDKKEGKIIVETDETATLLNLLVERLWEDKTIKKAAYRIKHPFLDKFQLLIEGKNIKKSVEDACNSIINDCNNLLKKL
ncbi:MAG: hypothetical protein B6U88_01625 [Candidatus Aenigmarchaeota archaeon ex4484_56]|nr:MAG: hypothetical protein B6U88_01625 [Candidatus Aenigmarchaeota archaeon ex4484_56]